MFGLIGVKEHLQRIDNGLVANSMCSSFQLTHFCSVSDLAVLLHKYPAGLEKLYEEDGGEAPDQASKPKATGTAKSAVPPLPASIGCQGHLDTPECNKCRTEASSPGVCGSEIAHVHFVRHAEGAAMRKCACTGRLCV